MTSHQSISDEANRKNLRLLIGLRSAAFCAQLAAVLITYYGLNIVLPVATMIGVAGILAVFNLYSLLRIRSSRPVTTNDLFAGLIIDVIVLTLQLHFSGGTSNPLVSFYMLPVIIGVAMLDAIRAWAIYGLTIIGYLALGLFGPSLPESQIVHTSHAHGGALIDRTDLHMNGMMLGYFLCAGCLVAVVTRIRKNLSSRDAELEQAKTRTMEQDHILRMGLLAAGAAHELGTPLTTLSVILKDWRDLSPPRRKAERDAELDTMSAQLDRCKAIISDILTASGQSRGEGASVIALPDFLNGVCDRWRGRHPARLHLDLPTTGPDIVGDRVLEQTLLNLLDNALEASQQAGHDEIRLRASVSSDSLTVEVEDSGTGFEPEILDALGRPFNSTKAAAGRGLGLFLVRNTVQSLGGDLQVISGAKGSQVRLTLPLTALQVDAHV